MITSIYNISEEFLNTSEEIIKLSDYNKLAKMYNLPIYNLKDEYVVMANYENIINARNQFLKDKPDIELNGKVTIPIYNPIKITIAPIPILLA